MKHKDKRKKRQKLLPMLIMPVVLLSLISAGVMASEAPEITKNDTANVSAESGESVISVDDVTEEKESLENTAEEITTEEIAKGENATEKETEPVEMESSDEEEGKGCSPEDLSYDEEENEEIPVMDEPDPDEPAGESRESSDNETDPDNETQLPEGTGKENAGDQEDESEDKIPYAISDEMDVSLPDGINLSSMRLIIGTWDQDLLAEETAVISRYENIYILQFDDMETAVRAYVFYSLYADFVEADTGIAVAEGSDEEAVITDTVMTADNNPLSQLEEAVNYADCYSQSYDIALIDTGANGADCSVSMTGDDTYDYNGHGTRMLEAIKEQNPGASVISIKALGNNGTGDISAVYAAIQYAVSQKVKIINLSVSAIASTDSRIIEEAVSEAAASGIMVVGAAGNNGRDAALYIPGRIESALIIGAAAADGQRLVSSNYGATVDYYAVAETTSEAAARFSGFVSMYGLEGIYSSDNDGLIFQKGYDADRDEEAEDEDINDDGTEEDENEEGSGTSFRTAGFYSFSNWYSGGTKVSGLPSINEWLAGHPGGKMIDIVNYNRSSVDLHGLNSYVYGSNNERYQYVNYVTGADQNYSDVYWTISDPVSGYTYKVTLERIINADPYDLPNTRAGTTMAFGVSDRGWFYCKRFFSDPQASQQYSYFTTGNYLNKILNDGFPSPMLTYVCLNIKAYKTDDPGAGLDLPYLFIGWADIDAGQFVRNMSESFTNREIYKSDTAWAYDYPYGSGYDTYINNAKSSIYADGYFGLDGAIIYQETDQDLYTGSGVNTIWAWTTGAGANVRFMTLAYPVTYRAEEGGSITGITSEDVIHGRISSGSTAESDEGYVFDKWLADTDVTLSDGTVIDEGDILTDEQIADAVITEPVNFTAYFERVDLVMPEAGAGDMKMSMTAGLLLIIVCGNIFMILRRIHSKGTV